MATKKTGAKKTTKKTTIKPKTIRLAKSELASRAFSCPGDCQRLTVFTAKAPRGLIVVI
jgi:hypothetical protein